MDRRVQQENQPLPGRKSPLPSRAPAQPLSNKPINVQRQSPSHGGALQDWEQTASGKLGTPLRQQSPNARVASPPPRGRHDPANKPAHRSVARPGLGPQAPEGARHQEFLELKRRFLKQVLANSTLESEA